MSVDRLSLTDAISALPFAPTVQYSLWAGAASMPGLVQGEWGPWLPLTRPYTISKPKDSTRALAVAPGGEEYIKALAVYCAAGLPPEMLAPAGRTCRIRCSHATVNAVPQFRADDVYRVVEIRTWDQVSDHAEIHCRRDLGEAEGQV